MAETPLAGKNCGSGSEIATHQRREGQSSNAFAKRAAENKPFLRVAKRDVQQLEPESTSGVLAAGPSKRLKSTSKAPYNLTWEPAMYPVDETPLFDTGGIPSYVQANSSAEDVNVPVKILQITSIYAPTSPLTGIPGSNIFSPETGFPTTNPFAAYGQPSVQTGTPFMRRPHFPVLGRRPTMLKSSVPKPNVPLRHALRAMVPTIRGYRPVPGQRVWKKRGEVDKEKAPSSKGNSLKLETEHPLRPSSQCRDLYDFDSCDASPSNTGKSSSSFMSLAHDSIDLIAMDVLYNDGLETDLQSEETGVGVDVGVDAKYTTGTKIKVLVACETSTSFNASIPTSSTPQKGRNNYRCFESDTSRRQRICDVLGPSNISVFQTYSSVITKKPQKLLTARAVRKSPAPQNANRPQIVNNVYPTLKGVGSKDSPIVINFD
ncbi:hypothetical protein ARMSODRAFT_1026627 [Armillaria solidipes]|uniref:Uncharacterized protein n=1 Tax=Armillaria solidipes TaxID=1076256 RepID=A0A2H3AUE2_9AGAR|nr:hypothetical protein ARMSODRAFT_1026627 [Armillaria solidipes]